MWIHTRATLLIRSVEMQLFLSRAGKTFIFSRHAGGERVGGWRVVLLCVSAGCDGCRAQLHLLSGCVSTLFSTVFTELKRACAVPSDCFTPEHSRAEDGESVHQVSSDFGGRSWYYCVFMSLFWGELVMWWRVRVTALRQLNKPSQLVNFSSVFNLWNVQKYSHF